MTQQEYRRLSEKEMTARRWWTNRELVHNNMRVPAGSEVKITRKFNGLDVEGLPCPHCGVAVRLRRVSPTDIYEISE
jgi:hypothetical protein